MELEELICEQCSSHWQRAKARGRKPKACPTCLSSQPPLEKIEDNTDDEEFEHLEIIDDYISDAKYKPNSKWRCPACSAKLKVGVGIDYPPVHRCPKRANRNMPLELI